MHPLRTKQGSFGDDLFAERDVTHLTEFRERLQEILVDDRSVHCSEIGAHPRDYLGLRDRWTEKSKRASGEQGIEGRRFNDTDGGVNGSAGHAIDDIILLGEIIFATGMGANVNEPMALELRETATGVLDEILMENVLAFCGLPAPTYPAGEPLRQTLDGVIGVRIDDEVFVVEASVVEDHDGSMDGREFSALIGLGVGLGKTLGTGEMARFRKPDRKSRFGSRATVASAGTVRKDPHCLLCSCSRKIRFRLPRVNPIRCVERRTDDGRRVLVGRQDRDKTTTENGLLKGGLFDVKPDATAKGALL